VGRPQSPSYSLPFMPRCGVVHASHPWSLFLGRVAPVPLRGSGGIRRGHLNLLFLLVPTHLGNRRGGGGAGSAPSCRTRTPRVDRSVRRAGAQADSPFVVAGAQSPPSSTSVPYARERRSLRRRESKTAPAALAAGAASAVTAAEDGGGGEGAVVRAVTAAAAVRSTVPLCGRNRHRRAFWR
jgi:hypothetical protein